ncbi:MAG: hypothetical protein RMK94_14555 [Armatimonadota bacterium]|nr:hypothetical protein [Armatimonadota bacterium]
MRQKVVHYRIKRKRGKFELQPPRWKPKGLKLIEQQKCRRCQTTICLWSSGKLSIILAKATRKCCFGQISITVKLSQNHCR